MLHYKVVFAHIDAFPVGTTLTEFAPDAEKSFGNCSALVFWDVSNEFHSLLPAFPAARAAATPCLNCSGRDGGVCEATHGWSHAISDPPPTPRERSARTNIPLSAKNRISVNSSTLRVEQTIAFLLASPAIRFVTLSSLIYRVNASLRLSFKCWIPASKSY